MSGDPNKKSARTFQCRDVLWETFEQMARDLECSIDYLINEAMKQYARQRTYGARAPFPGSPEARPSYPHPTGQPPMAAHGAPPPPPPPGGSAPAGYPAPPGPPGPPGAPPPPPAASGRPPSAAPPKPPGMPPGPPGPAPGGPPPMGARPGGPPPPPPGARPSGGPPPPPPGAGPPPPPGGYRPPGAPQGAPPPGQYGAPPPPPPPPGAGPAPGYGQPAPPPGGGPAGGNGQRLVLYYRGQRHEVNKDRFIIGRGKQSSDLTIKDPNVSRQHAMIECLNGQYFMVDMGSTNGIEFNGQRLQRKPVASGDVFNICDHELRFVFE